MSETITLSVEQQQAICSDKKSLLISASAGSGKTKVLIDRITRLLTKENIDLDSMLIVTFTKLASLEMKNRLKAKLEEMPYNQRVQEQLEDINIASIGTFHQFCQNVIKEFFYIEQLEPNFSVLDEINSKLLKTRAIERVIKKYSQSEDKIFESLYEIFYESRNQESFIDNIMAIYDFLKCKKQDFFKNTLEKNFNIDFEQNPCILYMKDEVKEILSYFTNCFTSFLLEAQMLSNQKLCAICQENLVSLQDIASRKFADIYNCYSSTKFSNKKIINPTSEESQLLEKISECKKLFRTEFEKITPCIKITSMDLLKKDFEVNKQYLSKFYEVIKSFESEYKKLKKESNGLDFNDLEHYCKELLGHNIVRQELQNRYKYIFIDEYQDTNEIQEEIIELLTSEYTNLFMVGDVKQSIYAFRESNPQIFISKSQLLSNNDKESLIKLNANYRSDKDILEFNNLVFSNIMREQTTNIDYRQTSQFVFGNSFKKTVNNLLPVNICLVNTSKEAQEEKLDKIYSVSQDKVQIEQEGKVEKEANVVLEKITSLLKSKFYDTDTKTERNFEYKDIAILTRTKKAIKQIAKVLMKAGIPVSTEYDINLFESEEIKLLICLLKLIYNPQDDYSLASVLKSFLVKMSNNDLAKIRQNADTKFFYLAVQNYSNKQDEIAKKINNFYQLLELLRKKSQLMRVYDLIIEILSLTNYYENLSKANNFLEAKENVSYFLQKIKYMELGSLSTLLNYVDSFSKKSSDVISIKSSLNSVFIGTIHSSKGLEYPVVFLVNLEKKFSNQDTIKKLVKNSLFGLSISTYDVLNKIQRDCIVKKILNYSTKQQSRQEEIRLLYVGLTRAKCHLFIVGACEIENIKKLDSDFLIKRAQSQLDYILGSVDVEKIIANFNNEQPFTVTQNNTAYSVQIYKDATLVEIEHNAKEQQTDIQFLTDYFNVRFSTNNYAFKNTVTALMESDNNQEISQNNYNIDDLKIKYSNNNEDTDFLLIGTNYHKVMQMLDFYKDSVSEQIKNLVSCKKLEEKDLECVNLDKIAIAVNQLKKITTEQDIVNKEKQFMFYPKLCDVLNCTLQERVLVQGVVDLIIIKPEEIYLVDYKTSRIDSEELIAKKYQLQLQLYSQAIEKFYNKPVTKKFIYSFYLDKLIIV